jgi:hypothetical protein
MSEDDVTARKKRPTKKKTPRKRDQYISPDGLSRPPKIEHNLNECFAIIFRGAAGETVLNYLKSITTNRVLEPGLPENTYSYSEGARWLMGVIDTRKKHGEEKKP